MNAKPIARGLSLCDYLIVEERTKKVSLIGNFSTVKARYFPAILQPFSVCAVLTDGLGTARLRLIVT